MPDELETPLIEVEVVAVGDGVAVALLELPVPDIVAVVVVDVPLPDTDATVALVPE